jgi:DNA repair protein RadC
MNDKMLDSACGKISSFEEVLTYSVGAEKTHEITERLLRRYGSFSTAFSASTDELCFVGDMSRNTALLIKLIAYLHSRAVTERFTFGGEYSELEIREYIGAIFLGSSVESVYVLLLDDNGRVIHTEHISDGTVNASDVVPRKILESARRRNSKKIILAHNHPKGRAVASKDDIMTTGRLFNLFASVGVRLVAHYIVADGEVGVISADMLYDPDSVGKK